MLLASSFKKPDKSLRAQAHEPKPLIKSTWQQHQVEGRYIAAAVDVAGKYHLKAR